MFVGWSRSSRIFKITFSLSVNDSAVTVSMILTFSFRVAGIQSRLVRFCASSIESIRMQICWLVVAMQSLIVAA